MLPPPLEADERSGGVAADHLIVKMEPVNMVNNQAARTFRTVQVRPMPISSMITYNMEMKNCDWENLFMAQSAHEKAAILQDTHVTIVEKCFPTKTIKVSSDDCPWWTNQLQDLHRTKQRIYRKQRKSFRWKCLETQYQKLKKIN